jgi:hypothetical protein
MRRNQQRFVDGQAHAMLYPQAHPARPDRDEDVWAFASLGETLNLVPSLSKDKSDAYWRIAHLRNSIAHGHYVCWIHIKQATAAIRRFGLR